MYHCRFKENLQSRNSRQYLRSGFNLRIDIDENALVHLDMTLTAPSCPVAQTFPIQVADAIRTVEGVADVQLEMVWDPTWSVERMTEEAKVALGFFD